MNIKKDQEGVETTHPRGAAAGIILNPRGELLLLLKDGGYIWGPWCWGLPGGGIEEGENPLAAFIREVEEEFNIKELKDIRPLGIYQIEQTSTSGKFRSLKAHIFSALFSDSIDSLKINEGAGFGFFPKSIVETLPIISGDNQVIKEYYKSLSLQKI